MVVVCFDIAVKGVRGVCPPPFSLFRGDERRRPEHNGARAHRGPARAHVLQVRAPAHGRTHSSQSEDHSRDQTRNVETEAFPCDIMQSRSASH